MKLPSNALQLEKSDMKRIVGGTQQGYEFTCNNGYSYGCLTSQQCADAANETCQENPVANCTCTPSTPN